MIYGKKITWQCNAWFVYNIGNFRRSFSGGIKGKVAEYIAQLCLCSTLTK